ncbi:MAG: DNA-binding protein, partial [Promethearchaeota archaeon]
MSEEEDLENIRKRKIEELQQRALQQQYAEKQQQDFENKKYLLMRKILS